VEYSLTDTGKTLLPVLETMYQWGINYANEAEPMNHAKFRH